MSHPEKIEEILETLPFWPQLSKEEIDLLRRSCNMRQYKKNTIIHGYEEECLGMIRVVSGMLRVSIISEEGREITLLRVSTGEYCVLSASCVIHQITFNTQITTEDDTDLLIINTSAFKWLTEKNIYARCFMYELFTEHFSEVMWTMEQILFMGYDKRLALFLEEEWERTGSQKLHMTHEQIARNTGSAREVVSRMLRRFAEDGIVTISRGVIYLKDPEKLKNLTN